MRVLHLTPEYPPVIWGGLGTAVGGLVTASARAGISIGVLLVGGVLAVGGAGYGLWRPSATDYPTDESPVTDAEGVMFFHVPPDEAVDAAIRLVRRWRPDVMHLHTAGLWHVARAIHERTGIPLVFTVHSIDRAEYEIGYFSTHWEAQEVVIQAATRVIALSGSERDLLTSYCPEADGRVRIVGNGIEDSAAANTAARRSRLPDAPLVLYSGRFVDRKGIRELLAAIPHVLERAPNTRFVLVGGYGGGAEIERQWLTEALHAYRASVHFTGWLAPREVASWYARADMLVVPSWYEPFGMVVLEGMLYGLPIVAAAVGGPAEILAHDRTALLYPAKDTAALTEALMRLVGDPVLRRRIGAAAADEVRRYLLWPEMVVKMGRVYQEAIDAARLTRPELRVRPEQSLCDLRVS
jgi:glycogen synthase